MTILRSLERRGADPTQPWGDSTPPTNVQAGLFGYSGTGMSDDRALSISTVMSCISLIANGISTTPLGARKRSDGTKTDTPLLLRRPWPECTLQDWLVQVMVSLLLRGNFYGRIVTRDAQGYPTTIMPLHPDRVSARRDDATGAREYRVNGKVVPLEDIVHIRGMLTPGSFVGLNPVEYARTSWGLAAAQEQFGANSFSNSATPGGAIEVPSDLDDDETLALARAWMMHHQGVGNAQIPAVLTGGAQWKQISLSLEDAQFVLSRGYQREEIISWFRIPPHKMGLQDRTPSSTPGIEQVEMGYVIDTLMPWYVGIEQCLDDLTRPSIEPYFDLSHRLRGDSLQRAQVAQIQRNGGIKNADEIRKGEGLSPIPGGKGEIYLQPVNMIELGTTPPSPSLTVHQPGPPNDSGVNNTDGHGGAVGKDKTK